MADLRNEKALIESLTAAGAHVIGGNDVPIVDYTNFPGTHSVYPNKNGDDFSAIMEAAKAIAQERKDQMMLQVVQASPQPKTIGWRTYETVATGVFNPKGLKNISMSSKGTRAHRVTQILQRPLPGREACQLTVSLDEETLDAGVYVIISGPNDKTSSHRIGRIDVSGYRDDANEANDEIEDSYSTEDPASIMLDILSSSAMKFHEVTAIEGPSWEDIRHDSFWATFLKDACELTQIAIVHVS